MKKYCIYLIIASLCTISLSGCATLFGKSQHPLDLQSTPSKAKVYINDEYVGETPLNLSMKADKAYKVEFRLPGHTPVIRNINNIVEVKWVILDVLGGLLPVVIDAATGNWYKLSADKVNVIFPEKDTTQTSQPVADGK